MPSNPQIPLVQAIAVVGETLCDIKSPQDILDLVAENMVADSQAVLAAINNGIYFGVTEPTGDNFGKLWVKSTGTGPENPRGLGLVVNGQYTIIPIVADQVNTDEIRSGDIIISGSTTAPPGWSIYPGSPPVGAAWIVKN